MLKLCTLLLLAATMALAQPLEQGTVPNDQYTAAPAPPPLGTDGWRTGRSTFFDGSDTFKNAYLARYSQHSNAHCFVPTQTKSPAHRGGVMVTLYQLVFGPHAFVSFWLHSVP